MVAITNDVEHALSDRTAITSVRFHYSTVTSGAAYDAEELWVDLGAVDEGSPAFDLNKDITDVMTGAPKTIKDRHINQYNGTMSCDIIDYSATVFNATIGTDVPNQITSPMGWVDTTVDAGASTRSLIYLVDVSDIAVGDRIAFQLGGSTFSWFEDKKIINVTKDPDPDVTGTVEIEGTLSQIPVSGAEVKKVEVIETIIGGNNLRDYQMRSVASFNDGSTMVIHAPKGNFTGAISPDYGGGDSVAKIPVEFGLIGSSATLPGSSCKQVKLASHYSFFGNC